MERVVGIEPTFPAWKAGVLPIYDTRILLSIIRTLKWSARRDSNPQLPPWKGGALPIELLPQVTTTLKRVVVIKCQSLFWCKLIIFENFKFPNKKLLKTCFFKLRNNSMYSGLVRITTNLVKQCWFWSSFDCIRNTNFLLTFNNLFPR